MDWSEWIQSIGTTAANVYAAKETAQANAQQNQPAPAVPAAAGAFNLPPSALLLGGLALVAVLLLKD